MKLETVLRSLYESEINFKIEAFWDGGIDVHLGDELNGYLERNTFYPEELDKASLWLDEVARIHFPESQYAKSISPHPIVSKTE